METSRIVLLVSYTCLLGVGQLLFKLSARNSTEHFNSILFSPMFVASIVLYGGLTVFWVWLLKTTPLSRAYPFVALTFIITPLLGVMVLSEPLGRLFWPGAIAIVIGVILIAQP